MSNVDELVAPSATEVEEGSTTDADSATFGERGARALALDQGLPQLLYELAVRLPVRPDIQALCVWLYEPDRPFNREFEAIKKFEAISRSHPSQLALFQVGRNDAAGCFYYVMELADAAAKPECRMPKPERSSKP